MKISLAKFKSKILALRRKKKSNWCKLKVYKPAVFSHQKNPMLKLFSMMRVLNKRTDLLLDKQYFLDLILRKQRYTTQQSQTSHIKAQKNQKNRYIQIKPFSHTIEKLNKEN